LKQQHPSITLTPLTRIPQVILCYSSRHTGQRAKEPTIELSSEKLVSKFAFKFNLYHRYGAVFEYPYVPSVVSGASSEFEKAVDYFASNLVDLRGPAYEYYTRPRPGGMLEQPEESGAVATTMQKRFGAFTDANVVGEMVKSGLAVFRDGSVFRSLGVVPSPPCDDITGKPLRFMVHVTRASLCDAVRGGAVQVESGLTLSLKAPGFNP
jgi:hypothetical protein